MSTHLSLDVLADLLAGEGDDTAVAHVEACGRCAQALVELDAALVPVAAELAALAAAPLPALPDDLEQRLLAALREQGRPERPSSAPTLPTSGVLGASAALPSSDVLPEESADVVPLRRRAGQGSAPRGAGLLGAAAAAVGLLAVVGLGAFVLGSGSGGSADSASGGGTAAESSTDTLAAPAEVPTSASGNDYAPDPATFARVLPVLLDPGTLGGGTAALDAGTDAGRAAGDAAPAPVAGATSGGADTLSEEGSGSEKGSGTGGTAGGSAGGGPAAAAVPVDPLARLREPAALAGCLAALTGPDSDGVPLALDYATYEGRPALVVVLPSAQERSVDVFAVGAGCRAGADSTLFFARLPRP